MIIDLIKKTRSIRRFDEAKPITEDIMMQLAEAARLSACAANLQTLRFYLSYNENTNQLIFPHLKWAGYLRYWDGPKDGERPTAYMIILAPAAASSFHLTDAGIAVQSMLLTASEHNIGGCIIASVDKNSLQTELKIAPEYSIVLVLALGYPAEKVIIEEVIDPDDIEYWRDDEGVHHVPKRALEDIIIS